MNSHMIFKILVVSAFFTSSCLTYSAAGWAQEQGLVATVQSVQDDLRLAQLQSEATEEALDELALTDVADLEQAFAEFSAWVGRMADTGNRLVVHADQMHYNGPSYLVESGQTPTACTFPRLRVPQDSPQAQLGEYFDAVAAESWKVKRAYRAFEFDIIQIDAVLDKNLTPRQLDGLMMMIRKARVDVNSFQEALARAQAVLDRAKVASQAARAVPS